MSSLPFSQVPVSYLFKLVVQRFKLSNCYDDSVIVIAVTMFLSRLT